MSEVLDNKELAIIAWSIIIIGLLLYKKDIRKSLYKLICTFLSPKLSIIYIMSLLYNFVCIMILYLLNYWNFGLLKETILWILLVSITTIFKIQSVKIIKNYFIEIINENLKWTLILEFMIGLYSFSIWFEIISLPIFIILGLFLAVAENNPNHSAIARKLKNGIFIFGFILSIYALFNVVNNYRNYLNFYELKEFLMPILLSILYIPFLYIFYLYINYETVFCIIDRVFETNENKLYTKFKLLFKFNINISKLLRWREMFVHMGIKGKDEVNESIDKILELQKIEKNPPIVSIDKGWSPYISKNFLIDKGLSTGHYNNYSDDLWFACSPYFKVMSQDESFLNNTISYYINGNENIATSLKLILNINDTKSEVQSKELFLQIVILLYERAINGNKNRAKIEHSISAKI